MPNFKIKIKSRDEKSFATDSDIEVLDPSGNIIKGLFELCFTARAGQMPILSLSTYLTDLELDIPRENVFLSVNCP